MDVSSCRNGNTEEQEETISRSPKSQSQQPIEPISKKMKLQHHVKGMEHIQRVNYLFQASEEMLKLQPPLPKLAQSFGNVLITVSEKTPAKLDFTMKRSLCKKCKTILVPGINVSYRLKRRKRKKTKNKSKKSRNHPTQIITCKSCGTYKTFSTNPNHRLKAEISGVVTNIRSSETDNLAFRDEKILYKTSR